MNTHTFTLVLRGPDVLTGAGLDALKRAGCDDATFGERDGVQFADFDRSAPSMRQAVMSAIRALEAAVSALRVGS